MTIRRHLLTLTIFGSMILPELGLADAVTEWNTIAQAGISAGNPGAPGARHSFRPYPRQIAQTLTSRLSVGVARLPASASADVSRTACVPDAAGLGAVCGYVKVPFDRAHPEGKSIPIYFELYRHSGPGPAESAILANTGGPGNATSGARFDFLDLFAPNMDVHDLLLVDDRGRGLSGALGVTNCLELQHGTAPRDQALADCAAELGDSASRYGTSEVAKDTEAVRAALGYDKVDYFGLAAGGGDVTAYATRFGEHLRSIVLDSPSGTPNLKTFGFDRFRARADPRIVRLTCLRAPTCSADHPDPDSELAGLIRAIHDHPVEGDAYDGNGNLAHVRINEIALIRFMSANWNYTDTGEILAAAASLRHGDSRPLLRLGVEGPVGLLNEGDNGDATYVSVPDRFATACVDIDQAWDWSATIPERKRQYAAAVADLPVDYFAPYSRAVTSGAVFSWFGRGCLYWQNPKPPPPLAPRHATYSLAPTLVLGGDMDGIVPIEETSQVAALFPSSTFVQVAGEEHGMVFSSDCARHLAIQFIETLRVGDLSCTRTPKFVGHMVARFPLVARDARPAEPMPAGSNQIDIAERKVVTVAVATATDALQRVFVGGSGIGVGLRSGTFRTDFFESSFTTTFNRCAFATDVFVSGTLTIQSDYSIVANLAVTGPGTAGGKIHVVGFWQALEPAGNFKVTGTLGGKRVAVLVPEA